MDLREQLKCASWIWFEAAADKINQYGLFRRRFRTTAAAPAELLISADWDFVATLDGVEIGRGQFPDYEHEKTFTRYRLNELTPGEHTLEFLVYAPGAEFFSQLRGRPGVIAIFSCGDLTLATGNDWEAAPHPAFHSGEIETVTPQLGYTVLYDAAAAPSVAPERVQWIPATVRDSGVGAFVRTLSERPLPPIFLGERAPSRLCAHGVFTFASQPQPTFAAAVAAATYRFADGAPVDAPPADANGFFRIYDLGEERTGYAELDFDAPAGTVVDLSWGEHLNDQIVRCRIGVRNFTMRIVAREGENRLSIPFLRLGARYIQLNISGCNGKPVVIRYAGMRRFDYEPGTDCDFATDSSRAELFRATGLRTMRCCMHAHYEDCPWREQSLYAYDSRNQMLFGYYAWGNYDFAAASLDLLGRGVGGDGQLNLCAPTHRTGFADLAIPCFTRVWGTALREHHLYSGDDRLLHRFANQLRNMTELLNNRFDSAAGLYRSDRAKRIWNFYEWVNGLNGYGKNEEDFNALGNLYIYEWFHSLAEIFAAIGENGFAEECATRAAALGRQIENSFYDPGFGGYATTITGGQPGELHHVHTQALMLALGLVPPERVETVAERCFSSGEIVKASLSPLLYLVNGMFSAGPQFRRKTLELVDQGVQFMLDRDATTLWEVTEVDAFEKAGSLCHAWSAIHVYIYGAFVLGVKPLVPGFRRFEVKPWCGPFRRAAGSIPTPAGKIHVEWTRNRDDSLDLRVTTPRGLSPEIASWPECPVSGAEIREV